MDPCRPGMFVLEQRGDICRHRQPLPAVPSLSPLSPSATAALSPRLAAQQSRAQLVAEPTARGSQPSSCPCSASETRHGTGVGSCTSGTGGGQLHIWLRLHSTITSTSTSTFPPPVLLPLPSCSRRLEPTGHQCWVQSVSFTHTALSCSATPLSERWRGKGKKQNQKGCKHTLCSAGSSQQGLQVLLARRANFDSEDQTDPAFPYSLPHSGHSFGPWSLCTPHI